MKKLSLFVALLLGAFALTAEAAESPNAVSLEILGRGGLYSLNYDRMLTDDFALGAGFSSYSVSSGNSNAKALIFPIYGNYYFTGGPHRWFATAGANVISASGNLDGDAQISGSGVAGTLGGGYEYRGDSGFLFRAAPYVFVGNASGLWLGLSLGYAF